MKSLESICKEDIEKYMLPYPQYGMAGFSLEVSVKKAKASRIGWDDIFDRVADKMESEAA